MANNLSKNNFKSDVEFQNIVSKVKNTYKVLKDFEVKAGSMMKTNIQKGQNGFGEKEILSVLNYKKAIEKDCNEIVLKVKNMTNQKIKNEVKLVDIKPDAKSKTSENQIPKTKKEEVATIKSSQIESNSRKDNYNKEKDSEEINSNWIMPCEGRISSSYGVRKEPVPGASKFHSGIDIAVPVGTPVKAITDGKVSVASGGITGYGNAIYINHGKINDKIIESEYGHLSEIYVKKDQYVKKGQTIGLSGGEKGAPGSGYSSGPHLHLTIREYDLSMKNKKHENPNKYLNYN